MDTALTGRPAAAGCALAAAGFGLLILINAGETAPGMPLAPRPVAAAGALAAAVLIFLIRDRVRPALLVTVGVALAIMVSGSLAAIPHTALILIIVTISQFTHAAGPFDIEPPVLTMITHLTTAGAAFLAGLWLLGRWRALRGRCASCGRRDAEPVRPARTARLPILAAVAIIGALPYGLIKLAWAAGLKIGLPGSSFDSVSFASPGFGDTALLTGVSIIASVLMGLRVGHRLLRPELLAIGTIGSFMLVPVGIIGAIVGLIPAALGLRTIGDSEIDGWAYIAVYASFLVWGIGLCLLTISYGLATRPVCRRHLIESVAREQVSGAPVNPPVAR